MQSGLLPDLWSGEMPRFMPPSVKVRCEAGQTQSEAAPGHVKCQIERSGILQFGNRESVVGLPWTTVVGLPCLPYSPKVTGSDSQDQRQRPSVRSGTDQEATASGPKVIRNPSRNLPGIRKRSRIREPFPLEGRDRPSVPARTHHPHVGSALRADPMPLQSISLICSKFSKYRPNII